MGTFDAIEFWFTLYASRNDRLAFIRDILIMVREVWEILGCLQIQKHREEINAFLKGTRTHVGVGS